VYGLPQAPAEPIPTPQDVLDAEAQRAAMRARVVELASAIHAAEGELTGLIAQLDDADAWHGAGYTSLNHWLGVNAGFTPAEATRRVRIARRSADLPALADAAHQGRISVGLMDRAVRIADPETDAAVADLCTLVTPAQAMRVMAATRTVEADEEQDPEPPDPDVERTWLWKWWDDAHRLHIDGCLDAIDGALFESALDAARAAGERDVDDAHHVTSVEALGRMTELMLDEARHTGLTRDGTNFAVEVTIDADRGTCRFGNTHLTDHQAKEVACDCRLHHLIHQSGIALNMGREVRTATRAQRRALRLRDGGCAFPGCGQTRFVHAHHIRYWEHQGSTDLDNLVLLCSRHHRLLHEGDYSCVMGADQRPTFLDPNGDPLTGQACNDVVSPRHAWHERQRRRDIHPTAAATRTGGEPLTEFALDVLVESLLHAA